MYTPVDVVEVRVWEQLVGAVTLDPATGYYAFEFAKKWVDQGIDLSPFAMSLASYRVGQPYTFPTLPENTFKRLPAMLADALPDRFGNALIDAALADKGVPKEQVTPLDRLAYVANRAMGALEFRPPRGPRKTKPTAIELSLLVEGAKNALAGKFDGDRETEIAIRNIIHVGISAGGVRAKAVVTWHPESNEIRSAHVDLAAGFEHWLLKLDGVGLDQELGAGGHYGRIEYAYYLMAKKAGINIMLCRLLEENGRAHFMTKRFDRDGNTKHHIQTLCAMKELDYHLISGHSYSQYFETIRGLGLDNESMQEGFRRMVFNVLAANCDDHTKNFSFILKQGQAWALAPAYDVTHAHNPEHDRMKYHLLAVNGKYSSIRKKDLLEMANLFSIPSARDIIDEVSDAVSYWSVFSVEAGLPQEQINRVQQHLDAMKIK